MTQQVSAARTGRSEKDSLARSGETGIVVPVVMSPIIVSMAPSRLNVLLFSPAVA
jgi:hypothetical protein